MMSAACGPTWMAKRRFPLPELVEARMTLYCLL
jgi:hypothetical protein